MADVDGTSSLLDIKPDVIVQEWLSKFADGTFDPAALHSYWRVMVPKLYSPPLECDCLNIVYDEDRARKYLFAPMETLICSGDPPTVFQELKALDNPPTLCGKVFKNGEPTYSCRDCGMDPTCVLCVDCFKISAHRFHRYKMSTSGGGGYCDCGDVEAWKDAAFCDRHRLGAEGSEGGSSLDRMPKELVHRANVVLQTVLSYAYQLLTWERANDLPSEVQCKTTLGDDTYTTMVFNDEVHTYDQVIQTLNRAISCSQREAIDFATAIDREGRSIVKCSQFKTCETARSHIEKLTSRHGARPLKVVVMHTSVVAHQTFAMHLLPWLQTMIGVSEGLRQLFSKTIMQSVGIDQSVLEGVLRADTQLWKTARSQWHQLMICGMLMDQECKRAFAQTFTRLYPVLMKDFIADDHDHSLSITSLSVQIYTVPTLAHRLIMEENVVSILLRTFLNECEQRLNSEQKFAFERNQANTYFKRAQYILFDLKYLLNSKPEQWNAALRKHFLEGFGKLVTLLSYMQGMDASVRQVGQHMEFEPEWESAFNLHLRLAPVITLVLDWCGTDRIVLIKTYRAALKHLESTQGMMRVIGRELANHSATCIDYDVSSQPVSIHLPLSRLVSGLHLLLDRFDLTFDSTEFLIKNKPTPEQLIELPLRTKVMIAQVHAGMWRRNGYSLINQIYFYHTAKCRSEMLDRDVVMLQVGAGLIESNEFLLHVLNKFGLVTWAREEYETDYLKAEDDCMRQTIVLVEEFLGLLIQIVGERFTPGIGQVTEEDCIKKEVIQQLCIEPMAHSQLTKSLSEDPNHETGMETVIHEVAAFKKPQGTGRGMYEIKGEFLKDYNPFFYHYTREEQSRAEETQRKRKKQAGEEECCPPPFPPPLCPGFAIMVNVMQCDIMLHLMHIILERSSNLRARSFSETQFQKVLHLIGYALHEEQRYHDNSDPFFNFTDKATKKDILSQLEALVGSQRIEPHKELLNWTIRKFKQTQRLHGDSGTVAMETCERPADDAPTADALQEEKRRRAEIAAERRSRIMAQMSAMQKNFIREHADLFEKTKVEPMSFGSNMDLTEIPIDDVPICLGPKQTQRHVAVQRHTCILCQEDEDINNKGRAMVLAAFIQKSTVLSKTRGKLIEKPDDYDPLPFPGDLFCAPHTSTCSHVMHSDCWQKYFDSVLAKERRRPIRYRGQLSFDVDRQEFLCPLCECLSNTVLPLVPPVMPAIQEFQQLTACVALSCDDWLRGLQFAMQQTGMALTTPLSINPHGDDGSSATRDNSDDSWDALDDVTEPLADTKSSDVVRVCNLENVVAHLGPSAGEAFRQLFCKIPAEQQPLYSESLVEMIKIFIQASYTIGLGVNPNQEDKRVPLMTWWSCAYTIHTIEALLRDQQKPLFGELTTRQSDCLGALIRVASICGTSTLPDVLQLHAVRMVNAIIVDPANATSTILETDAFGSVVVLCFLLPYLFADTVPRSAITIVDGLHEQHIMTAMFTMHVVQILLTADLPLATAASTSSDPDTPMETEVTEEESALQQLLLFVRQQTQTKPDLPTPLPYQLLEFVQQSSIPFLRSAALFFHYLMNVPAPQALRDPLAAEFEPLLVYLSLPSFEDIWSSDLLKDLIQRWLSHKNLSNLTRSSLVQCPQTVNQLVKLPRDYSELINSVSLFTCPNSDGDDSRTPTMCLVCGEVLCSQSYCCQTDLDGMMVGACTYHAHFCGAGVGVFLRVRECKVLLLAGKTKGCFVVPPYLDAYGETDQGLRRGNPLHLCLERYKKLHKMWLSHGIPEEIAHALESNSNILSTDWHNL